MKQAFADNSIQSGQEQPFVLLHIPHSSAYIPVDLREKILLSDEELSTELLYMTDWYTDELFRWNENASKTIRYPVSRMVVDPERFLDDSAEQMAKVGMGVVYTRTSDGRVLRETPSRGERTELIRRFYEPHHSAMEEAVRASLEFRGSCLIIDCHSFPSVPLPYELDQLPDRPDICVGTDPFHTPDWLESAATELFRQYGFRVQLNRPFSGSFVPAAFYRQESAVKSIMIEVNRALYMGEFYGAKAKGFKKMEGVIRAFLASVCNGGSD